MKQLRCDEKLLILSDGKPGHLNQSIAFARLLDCEYTICRVGFANRIVKGLSYLLDRLGMYVPDLCRVIDPLPERCGGIVSAGSATYYANRALGRRFGVPTVAIMYPGGYRPEFDLIVAQEHDHPPVRDNILTIPVNLSAPRPAGLVQRGSGDGPTVALIIGGPSRHFRMDTEALRQQLAMIFALFPGADFLVTSSRRTPVEVERLIEAAPFRYRVIASREPVNPIADFLAIADYVFVTEDSTSMISEAVSFGSARVEVLPLPRTGERNKVQGMVASLAAQGYLHLFDGSLGDCWRKFDPKPLLQWRVMCA